MDINRFMRFWFPVLLYSGIIFYVSSVQKIQVPLAEFNFDKVVHVFEYLPFGMLLTRAIRDTVKDLSFRQVLLTIVVLSFLYGLSDEFHQYFVPGRSSSLFDAFADTIGGGIGCLIYCSFLFKPR